MDFSFSCLRYTEILHWKFVFNLLWPLYFYSYENRNIITIEQKLHFTLNVNCCHTALHWYNLHYLYGMQTRQNGWAIWRLSCCFIWWCNRHAACATSTCCGYAIWVKLWQTRLFQIWNQIEANQFYHPIWRHRTELTLLHVTVWLDNQPNFKEIWLYIHEHHIVPVLMW